jgi:putative transcriptional regulator
MTFDVSDRALVGGGIFEGKLLLALPGFSDGGCFDKSVIYVCAHSDDGAMGVIVNQLMPMVEFDDLLTQMNLPQSRILIRPDVLFGGPVETMRGFVIHSNEYMEDSSIDISDTLALNATVDILESIAMGQGPKNSLFTLGYAGWGPGQLEREVQENTWLVLDSDEDILFNPNLEGKWEAALAKLGVSVEQLTVFSGKA